MLLAAGSLLTCLLPAMAVIAVSSCLMRLLDLVKRVPSPRIARWEVARVAAW